MFKFKTTIVAAIIVAAFFTACNNHSETPSDQATPVDNTRNAKTDSSGQKSNAGIYYCPMHPEIVSDKPGTCPKCNMDLELKEDSVHGK